MSAFMGSAFVGTDPISQRVKDELKGYRPGGYHPVRLGDTLGDTFDGGRYEIKGKLGFDADSVTWMALDRLHGGHVALKIFKATEMESMTKNYAFLVAARLLENNDYQKDLCLPSEGIWIEGPNGLHPGMVLPVLGPTVEQVSCGMDCRVTPSVARNVAWQAAEAVELLHILGIIHGDLTSRNIAFLVSGLGKGSPAWSADLVHFDSVTISPYHKQQAGVSSQGPTAPSAIKESIDFMKQPVNLICPDDGNEVRLTGLNKLFHKTAEPPSLNTWPAFMAPELIAGGKQTLASDIWALGCISFHLRAGKAPFAPSYRSEFSTPKEVMFAIQRMLGPLPPSYNIPLFNLDGFVTDDPREGKPLKVPPFQENGLQELIRSIWDKPRTMEISTGKYPPKDLLARQKAMGTLENIEWPSTFRESFWKPKAYSIDGIFLNFFDNFHVLQLRDRVLPSIPEDEADLLYDLLSKIFMYEPERRINIDDVILHPYFDYGKKKMGVELEKGKIWNETDQKNIGDFIREQPGSALFSEEAAPPRKNGADSGDSIAKKATPEFLKGG